ncbi:MAG: cytochrome-c peroxidase [Deltaproteobacteria bacterium]
MTSKRWLFALAALVTPLVAAAIAAQAKPKASPPLQAQGIATPLYAFSIPQSDPVTLGKAKLGERLFNDKRVSADGTVSCATCHDPDRGFVDHKPKAVGIHKQVGTRNSPTVFDAMFNDTQFWDGRAKTLEDQAKMPILNPIEMGQKSPADIVAKVTSIPEYASEFRRLYGRPVTYDDLASALATFERTQIGGDSRFDRFLAGDSHALSASEQRGWALFNGKGRCLTCHAFSTTEPFFSDQKFHNIGIAAHDHDFVALARRSIGIVEAASAEKLDQLALETDMSELGRFMVTKSRADIGAFKTPTLRNIAVTGPYMHDGSLSTLWDVMDHYNKGGVQNPFLDGGMQRLGLSEGEIDDLVAFMGSLTSPRWEAYGKTELARQRALSRKSRPQRDTAVADGKKGDMGDGAPNPTRDPASLGVF